MPIRNRKGKREARQQRAEQRRQQRKQRSATQQLEELDRRLGEGEGAMKERARLNKEVFDAQAKLGHGS